MARWILCRTPQSSRFVPILLAACAVGGCDLSGAPTVELHASSAALKLADPASGRAVYEALRACASAGDRSAALRRRLEAPAAGRPAALLDAMEDQQRPVAERRCAALGLSLWPDPAAGPRLAALALDTPQQGLAGDAADALAAGGGADVVARLVAIAARDEFRVRRRAVAALAFVGRDRALRTRARRALGDLAAEGDPRIVEAALTALGEIATKEDAATFLAYAEDRDMLVRQRAIEGLASVATHDLLAHLVAGLSDPFTPVVAAAAQGLERLADPGSVAALGAYLDGPDRGAADAAMTALAAIGDPAAVRHITPYLFDRDGYLRVSAARALGRIGDPSALPHLDRALDTELINARTAVLDALAAFGPKAARLRSRLERISRQDDLDPRVAKAVGRALAAL